MSVCDGDYGEMAKWLKQAFLIWCEWKRDICCVGNRENFDHCVRSS